MISLLSYNPLPSLLHCGHTWLCAYIKAEIRMSALKLIKEVQNWSTYNILELYPLLNRLQEIAIENGQALEDLIDPDEVPTDTLPTDRDLTEVWAIDRQGMALKRRTKGRGKGRFQVVAVSSLEKAPSITSTKRRSRKRKSVNVRLEDTLFELMHKSMKRNFINSQSTWIRGAIELRLIKEGLLDE